MTKRNEGHSHPATEAVAQFLKLSDRQKTLEATIARLENRLRKLEKSKAPKAETQSGFRARVLAALGASR
jgi:septal ring factor EnvC (AmiA/AmiB activator)